MNLYISENIRKDHYNKKCASWKRTIDWVSREEGKFAHPCLFSCKVQMSILLWVVYAGDEQSVQ